MKLNKRRFLQKLAALSTVWCTGCSTNDGSLDGETENTDASTTTVQHTTTEEYVPEFNIESRSPNTHKITVQLGSFASVPTGTGTPVESGTFELNKEFSLSPGGEISLGKHRSPDHDYDVLVAVDGTVVVSEALYAYEGMTIKVLDSSTVDILRSDV